MKPPGRLTAVRYWRTKLSSVGGMAKLVAMSRDSLGLRVLLGLLLLWAAHGVLWAVEPVKGLTDQQRLERLERRVNKITELTLQVDALQQENRQLRGEIETLNHHVQQLQRKQRDIYADMDQRISSLPMQPVVVDQPPTPAIQEVPAEVTTPSGQNLLSIDPPPGQQQLVAPAQIQAEYDAAYALLDPAQPRYPQAIQAFNDFLGKYPKHKLAANAQYWLGETYYVIQDNAAALTAFKKVVEQYPESTKTAGAWYKIGRLEQANGRWKKAEVAYWKVLQKYPNSSTASLAKKSLDNLQAQNKQ